MAGERSYTNFSVDTDTGDADQNIDALLNGQMWNTTVSNLITYSFIDSASDISYALGGSLAFANAFSATQQQAAELALSMFAGVADVVFDEIGDDGGENNANGTLRFADFSGMSTAYGYYPFSGEIGGDMAFADGIYETAPLGSYEFHTLMHEIGHTMGLKHGHESGGPGAMTTDRDGMEYSVMTYNSTIGQGNAPNFYTNSSGNYAQSLMMYDIAALQRMYGANFTENASNTTYTFNTTTGEMSINGTGQGAALDDIIFRTVWDGNGTDTYDFSNFTTRLAVDLAPGAYSDLDTQGDSLRAELNAGWNSSGSYVGASEEEFASGHIYNALLHEGDLRSLIENATGGSNNDTLHGNQGNNTLNGGGGNDHLYGLGGGDTLLGGAGIDRLFGSGGWDELHGGSANDRMNGNSGNDELFGDAGNDRMYAGSGTDLIVGGAGADRMFGGTGQDTFRFDSASDSLFGSLSDKILDFETGLDLIDLSAMAASPFTVSIGSGFSGTGPSARTKELNSGKTLVFADVDGDGDADFRLVIDGVLGLTADDFVL